MQCPECGKGNPATAKFCGSCGQKLEAAQDSGSANSGGGGVTWDSIFKWIGIGVVGLIVLGMIGGL